MKVEKSTAPVEQVRAHLLILEARFYGDLCDEMCRGAIAAIERMFDEETITEPGLVICLSSLKYQWASQIERFTSGLPTRFEPSTGEIQLNGLIVDIDETNGRATRVERVSISH